MAEVVEEAEHSIMAKEVVDGVYLVRKGACLTYHFCRWLWDIWLQQQS